MNPPIYTLEPGTLPLLISMPHGGECLPEKFASRMTPAARLLADTDWHIARLYDFARQMGASVLRANYSRYLIDLNRPCSGEDLYPGQQTTTLCPTETFRGEPLYADQASQPDAAEIGERIAHYWQPYHAALQREIDRIRSRDGQVLVWEAHSIASVLPRLFEGRLPDLNIGSFNGAACAPKLRDAAVAVASASPFSWTVDARYKGGHITRHYGQPATGVHVVQLEMAQCLYMDECAPFAYCQDLAARLLPTLQAMVTQVLTALPLRKEGINNVRH